MLLGFSEGISGVCSPVGGDGDRGGEGPEGEEEFKVEPVGPVDPVGPADSVDPVGPAVTVGPVVTTGPVGPIDTFGTDSGKLILISALYTVSADILSFILFLAALASELNADANFDAVEGPLINSSIVFSASFLS